MKFVVSLLVVGYFASHAAAISGDEGVQIVKIEKDFMIIRMSKGDERKFLYSPDLAKRRLGDPKEGYPTPLSEVKPGDTLDIEYHWEYNRETNKKTYWVTGLKLIQPAKK